MEELSRNQSVLAGRHIGKSQFITSLEKTFTVIYFDEFCDNTEKYANDIEGIIISPYEVKCISDELISSLPNLRAISIHGAGVDGLDVAKLHKQNIRASNIPQVTAAPTADIAFLLILATARKLKEIFEVMKRITTTASTIESTLLTARGRNVTGATLGILGMGNIGYCVAQRATGFQMETLYHNRTRRSQMDEERVNAKYCSSLEELLKMSDFLVIAVPLTTETNNLIGQKELALMKPTSILINVSRGRVVDTSALVDALKNGTISAAGLDATEPEPLPHDHPLMQMDNVVLTGHTGTATLECRNDMMQHAIINLKAGITGGIMNTELFPNSD